MSDKQETVADIVAELRQDYKGRPPLDRAETTWNRRRLADRIEAAHKRERDSIHRAMVLIAGIEMEDSEAPPRLWTALEDAYDALSDALGTDGDATADMAEAEATGRHFVVKSSRNGAKMREALEACLFYLERIDHGMNEYMRGLFETAYKKAKDALVELPRNCDRFNTLEGALAGWREVSPNESGPFDNWLFAEVKGDAK